eukprot:EG_transcript_14180
MCDLNPPQKTSFASGSFKLHFQPSECKYPAFNVNGYPPPHISHVTQRTQPKMSQRGLPELGFSSMRARGKKRFPDCQVGKAISFLVVIETVKTLALDYLKMCDAQDVIGSFL